MNDSLHGLSFAALFDAVADAMLLVDAAGNILRANAAAQQLFDYGLQELVGMQVESLMPEVPRIQHIGDRQEYFNHLRQRSTLNGKNLQARRRDGTQLPVDIGLSPIIGQGKQFVLITFHGIEKQERAESSLGIRVTELQQARERYRVLIDEALVDMVLVHYRDGRIIEANQQAIKMLGYTGDELLKMHMSDITSDADLAELQAEWSKVHPGTPRQLNRHYRRKDGSVFPVEVHRGIQKFDEQRVYVCFARDITEREQMEARQKESSAEMEQLMHNQVAVQTAAAIAHELNQPLAAISAYSEVALHALLKDDLNQEQLRRAMEGCAAQAQRAGQSLHELIAYLQEGEAIAELLDLNAMVQTALNSARTNGFSKFHSRLDLEAGLPPVYANRLQVQKVLGNLINNSIEAMRDAGVKIASIVIRIVTMSEQGMAKVTIQDTGPGIDAGTVKRLFEPFFSTKPKGIGMGLIISRALIEANGGQLWFDPEDKPGATFYFTLPLAKST